MKDWKWRTGEPEESARLGLLYEPGGWGDVLKGVWTVELASRLAPAGAGPLRYADPFAGAPEYPVVGRTAERAAAAAPSRYHELQAGYLARGVHASTARLVAALPADALVYDADPARREAWRAVPGARVAEGVADGWDLLDPGRLGDRQLVLVDPFDLDRPERYGPALPAVAELSRAGVELVLYLYNRSPRSPGHLREYRRFRESLAARIGREPDAVGRIPTDQVLARAWHETILVRGTGSRLAEDAVPALRISTERLAWRVVRPGCFEPGAGSDILSPASRSPEETP